MIGSMWVKERESTVTSFYDGITLKLHSNGRRIMWVYLSYLQVTTKRRRGGLLAEVTTNAVPVVEMVVKPVPSCVGPQDMEVHTSQGISPSSQVAASG